MCCPCSHVFHPSALAQHFAYRNMRCPVCREGSDDTLVVTRSDIPAPVGRDLRKHVSTMHDEDDDDLLEVIPEIDPETLVRNRVR